MAVLPPDPVFVLRCNEMSGVNAICFHENERLLAGTLKGNVFLWDLQTNRSLLNFQVGKEPLQWMRNTEEILYTQEKGGTVKCWSMSNTAYVLQTTIENKHFAFCRSDMSHDESILVCPKEENIIDLIDLKDFTSRCSLVPDADVKFGFIAAMKYLEIAGQSYVLASYESGHLLTWDLRTNKVMNQLKLDEIPMAIDYDVVTNRGVCGGPENIIPAISYRHSMELTRIHDIQIKNPGINTIRIRPDQKVFVAGGTDSRIRIFSWKSLRPLAVLTEHKPGGITDIAFSFGKVSMWKAPIMAVSGLDGQISLWDLYK